MLQRLVAAGLLKGKTVAVDATGTSVHDTGPREWRARIGKVPVTVIPA